VPPADIQQAILKFKEAGVTNVTMANLGGEMASWTSVAQQQGFKPKYGLPDDGIIGSSYGKSAPNYDNLTGAVIITSGSQAEDRTPGIAPSAGTTSCSKALEAGGGPSVLKVSVIIGGVCNTIAMLKAGLEKAPAISRENLAVGLKAAGSIPFSYPDGPNDFSGDKVVTGGQYWRPVAWMTACKCWQVTDPVFRDDNGNPAPAK
jgi:hypothetical protein